MRGRRVAVVVLAVTGLLCVSAAVAARSPTLRIVFPEGFTARQMTGRVAAVRSIAVKKRNIHPAMTGKGYAEALQLVKPPSGFGARSLEGFLFPSLYDFGPSTTPAQLIRLQLAAFTRQWKTLDLSATQGLTPYQVLIVASMVEREVAVPAERPLVSAVIYNRLKQGMPLGIDATLRYGLGIPPTQSLTAAELANPTPYNTRIHAGLPPTPIGNPGLSALRAAAAPAAIDYLYYLRIPGTQTHYFTADFDDFCAHKQQYGYGPC
ncbi:MAG TPA: endolytic transglycosylase MltG [Gaiellaceae bacterium]